MISKLTARCSCTGDDECGRGERYPSCSNGVGQRVAVALGEHGDLVGHRGAHRPEQGLDGLAVPCVRCESVGGVEEADEPRLGEAWYQGPILLSWREVKEQCVENDSGRNVVIHEFAHLLDMQNHEIDGIPALDGPIHSDKWIATFRDEYERLIRQARLGRRTVLDYYGATSEAEFFAVASEAFFERAVQLRDELPELYAILHQFYRQDPAGRE